MFTISSRHARSVESCFLMKLFEILNSFMCFVLASPSFQNCGFHRALSKSAPRKDHHALKCVLCLNMIRQSIIDPTHSYNCSSLSKHNFKTTVSLCTRVAEVTELKSRISHVLNAIADMDLHLQHRSKRSNRTGENRFVLCRVEMPREKRARFSSFLIVASILSRIAKVSMMWKIFNFL